MILATSCKKQQTVPYEEALRVLFFPKPSDCTETKIPGIPVERNWWSEQSYRQFMQ